MNSVKLLSVFVENKPGLLARTAKALADAGVNILWFKMIDGDGNKFGVIRFLVDKIEAGTVALRNEGFIVSSIPVVAIMADNNPGTLYKLAAALFAGNVNVRNGSGYYLNGQTILMFETEQIENATRILEGQGYKVLPEN